MRNITTENYVIEFDTGYKSLTNIINERNYTKIFLLVDENTEKYCLNTFIKKTKLKPHLIKISSGEEITFMNFNSITEINIATLFI